MPCHRFQACPGIVPTSIDIRNPYFITSRKLSGRCWDHAGFAQRFPKFYDVGIARRVRLPLHPSRSCRSLALFLSFFSRQILSFQSLSVVLSFFRGFVAASFAQDNRNQHLDVATVNPLTPDVVSRVHAFARDNAIDLIHSMTYVSKIEIPKRYRVYRFVFRTFEE